MYVSDSLKAYMCTPAHEMLVLITSQSSEGSGETAQRCSLARAFTASCKTCRKRYRSKLSSVALLGSRADVVKERFNENGISTKII